MKEILKQSPLFENIPQEEIDKIFTGVFYQIKEYEPGIVIEYQDQKVEYLMLVLDGIVRGEMIDFSGKTIVIEEIESPRLLAPAFLFGRNNTYPVNIVSQVKTKILRIPRSEFVKMMQKNNSLLINFMNNISDRAQFLSQKLKFLSFHSIKGKLAYYLLSLSKNENLSNIILPLSQAKLADLFGVTRPSLGRAIREMHNDGIIISNGKNIKLVDLEELNKLIK